MEKFSVSRLVGAPPGYVGYEEGGQLTEKVRRKPYSVVLLDEIEKAHQDVLNILLQVLDDGVLTDGLGHRVDFRNTIIIMTSNIGARDIKNIGKGIGFSQSEETFNYQTMKSTVEDALKRVFNPEFLNRVDDVIVFHSLEKKHILLIIDIMADELLDRVRGLGIKVDITKSVKEFLVRKGFDVKFGARPLRRSIQKYIEDPLADHILGKNLGEGDAIRITATDKKDTDALSFSIRKNKTSKAGQSDVDVAEAPLNDGEENKDIASSSLDGKQEKEVARE